MASVHKTHGSKYWQCFYTQPSGKKTSITTKETDKEKALEFARALDSKIKEIRHGSLEDRIVRALSKDKGSIDNLIKQWLEQKRSEIGLATYKWYSSHIKTFLRFLGDSAYLAPTEIKEAHILSYRQFLIDTKRAPKTTNLAIKVLKMFFGDIHKRGRIPSDPTTFVKTVRQVSNTRDVFTPEQINYLVAVANDDWQGMILLGLYCGMRLRDAATLKRENIDLTNRLIIYKPAKLAAMAKPSMVVPLSNTLLEWLSRRMTSSSDIYIFPNLCNVKQGGRNGISHRFTRLMKKAGIDRHEKPKLGMRKFHGLTFHSLRHTCVSMMANAGVPEEIRRKIVGHTSSAHQIYTHIELETLRKSISTLDALEKLNTSPEINRQ